MSKSRIALAALALLGALNAAPSFARDDVLTFPIADVLNNPTYAARLEGVQFFFGDQPHPAVTQEIGEYTSNKKTNAFNKSDKEACEWAFLSALLSFRERALGNGANAVYNITGYYKKQPYSSATMFQCGAGGTVAGVTIKGTVGKVK